MGKSFLSRTPSIHPSQRVGTRLYLALKFLTISHDQHSQFLGNSKAMQGFLPLTSLQSESNDLKSLVNKSLWDLTNSGFFSMLILWQGYPPVHGSDAKRRSGLLVSPLSSQSVWIFATRGLNGLAFCCVIGFSNPDYMASFVCLTFLTQLAFGTTAEFYHNPVTVERPPREPGMCGGSDDTGQPEAKLCEAFYLFFTEFGEVSGGECDDRKSISFPRKDKMSATEVKHDYSFFSASGGAFDVSTVGELLRARTWAFS